MAELLKVEGLRTSFQTEDGPVHAVNGIDLCLNEGETLGLVGESGCGKSVTALSIMRLIAEPPGKVEARELSLSGKDLLGMPKREMRFIRGREVSMIFQEPMTSLDPVFSVGAQVTETIRLHQNVGKKEAEELAAEMLAKVGIPSPEKCLTDYPHQLSGGMRQRVMIAMALSCQPRLLIADEPTTALDVTIQAQILELIDELREELNMALIMITHDLGVIANTVDQVAVMYCGKIVEQADVYTLFENLMHPYTKGLMASLPKLHTETERLFTIPGTIPDPLHMPFGCNFHPRCPDALEICLQREPRPVEISPGHVVSCWKVSDML